MQAGFSYFWRRVCTENQVILEHTCMKTLLTYFGENYIIKQKLLIYGY